MRAVAEASGAEDPLAALREHVRSAQQAAERLAGEAGLRDKAAGAAEPTPPSGWAEDADREAAAELRALVDLVESLRRLLPDELREQLTDLIRQLLLLLRAIIDWLVARIEREGKGREVAVEDIPVL
jgi:hypothetical protein